MSEIVAGFKFRAVHALESAGGDLINPCPSGWDEKTDTNTTPRVADAQRG